MVLPGLILEPCDADCAAYECDVVFMNTHSLAA